MQIAMFNGQPVGQLVNGTADISFDDTMLQKEDGSYSVTTPVKSILTQEEFDALPEEERNKGLYIIKGGTGNGSSSGSFKEVYSEEETVIGTWMGKPLYRKIITGVTPATNTFTEVSSPIASIEQLCRLDIMLNRDNSSWWTPCPYATSTDTGVSTLSAQVERSTNQIYMIASKPALQNSPFTAIVEYTKTTD